MASDYLLETHAYHDLVESERVFGDESAFDTPNLDLVFDKVKRVAIFAEAFLPKVDGVSKTACIPPCVTCNRPGVKSLSLPRISPPHPSTAAR